MSTYVKKEDEPYPPLRGEFWEDGSKEYLARLAYIANRVDAFFNRFEDSIEYDFTRLGFKVETARNALLISYKDYAAGRMSVLGVKMIADNFLAAVKREIKADVPRPAPHLDRTTYRREVGHIKTALSIREDAANRLSLLQQVCERITSNGELPPTGVTSYPLDGGEGVLLSGESIPRRVAERLVRREAELRVYGTSKIPDSVTPLPLEYVKTGKSYLPAENGYYIENPVKIESTPVSALNSEEKLERLRRAKAEFKATSSKKKKQQIAEATQK